MIVKLCPAVMTTPALGLSMGFAAELGYFCVRGVTLSVDIVNERRKVTMMAASIIFCKGMERCHRSVERFNRTGPSLAA